MTSIMEASGHAPKVLIADDDPGIVRFLAKQCAKMGFDVQTAANGVQALIMAGRSHPDALIVDINMPEMDGMSVAARLMEPDKKRIEVIVITSSAYPGTPERCESFGAFHVRKGRDLWDGVRSALIEIFPDMAHGIEKSERSPPRVEWQRPRILVVDGDPEVGKFLASRLGKVGVDTLVAYDAAQGFQTARREQPSVIILDFPMARGDAYYFLSRLRTTPETDRIPIFVMSAHRLDALTVTNLKREVSGGLGAIQFFTKSSDTDELFTALQKFCAFTHNPNPPEDVHAPSEDIPAPSE